MEQNRGYGLRERVETAQREMAALREQIHKLEGSGGSEGMQVTANRLPAAELDYVRKLRDVKYHETLLELLAKQYEAAYIDEAKSAPVIQVVDHNTGQEILAAPRDLY